jgi:glucose-6-phosphate dehydrogenase assembly protein OpcA
VEAAVTLQGSGPELEYTLGSSRRIRLRKAEAELQALWEVASQEAERKGQEGVLRLREFNLVVYALGDSTAERVSQVIARLAQRHPARAIILLDTGLEAAAEDVADAWVSAACYLTPQGERHVCWEQVTIPAWGRAAHLLDTTAMPVMVPHLPTILWWPGQPDLRGDAFRRLGEVSALLLVDSAGFADPVSGLTDVARVIRDRSRNYQVKDLNWSRLTAWREMVADLFDDQRRLEMLQTVDSIRVVYGAEDTYERPDRSLAPSAARALLVAGWLGSRLGWRPGGGAWETDERRSGVDLRDSSDSDRVIRLVLEHRPLSPSVPGGLVAIEMTAQGRGTGDGRAASRIRVGRMGESCVCESRVEEEGAATTTRTVDMAPVPEDRLLAEELDQLGPDRVYEEALAFAVSLLELKGGDRVGGIG